MNSNLTEIIFIMDRSGSMAGLERDTIGGFNAFIEKQKQMEGEITVTTILFDNRYELLWDGINAEKAKLTNKEYFVRGSTALLDAVGKTILDVGGRLSNTKEEHRPVKVIVVITTDGMENASREFTSEKVKQLIKHQQEKYHWEFIFLGANMEVAKEAGNIGISEDNAYNFEASDVGVRMMYSNICEEVAKKRNKL